MKRCRRGARESLSSPRREDVAKTCATATYEAAAARICRLTLSPRHVRDQPPTMSFNMEDVVTRRPVYMRESLWFITFNKERYIQATAARFCRRGEWQECCRAVHAKAVAWRCRQAGCCRRRKCCVMRRRPSALADTYGKNAGGNRRVGAI